MWRQRGGVRGGEGEEGGGEGCGGWRGGGAQKPGIRCPCPYVPEAQWCRPG